MLCAVILTYLPSLGGGWAYDDLTWATHPADLYAALHGAVGSPIWRPLGALPTALIHSLWVDPLPHRVLSLILHLVAVSAVGHIATAAGARPSLAWFAAALFGVHTGTSEPVAWISCHTELIPAVLTLTGWAALTRGKEWTAGLLWGLAPFGKEAWILLPLSGALWCLGTRRWSWRAVGTASLGAAVYLVLRQSAQTSASLGSIDPDILGPLGYIALRGIGLLFVPASADVCPLYAPAPTAGAVVLVAGLVALACTRGRPWLAALLVPLPILAPNALASARNGIGADRYYYLAIAGIAIAIALAAESLRSARPNWTPPRLFQAAWLIPVALAPLTALRARDWGDNLALFSASLAIDPVNPFSSIGYAAALSSADRCEEAIPHFRVGLKKDPQALTGLQACLGRLGHLEAIVALSAEVTTAQQVANLARALLLLGRTSDARMILDRATADFPDDHDLAALRDQAYAAAPQDPAAPER